jgi:hypothetical protein
MKAMRSSYKKQTVSRVETGVLTRIFKKSFGTPLQFIAKSYKLAEVPNIRAL